MIDAHGFDHTPWTIGQAAGCLIVALDTRRILFAHRSAHVLEPGTWGTWGGKVEEGAIPVQTVRTEVEEECKYNGPLLLKPLLVFKRPNFEYHNFLGVVHHEFEPRLNWESQGSAWVGFNEWPQPLHSGVKLLLNHRPSLSIMQRYCE